MASVRLQLKILVTLVLGLPFDSKTMGKTWCCSVLRSDEHGVGKSSFVNYIGKMLGNYYLAVHQLRHLAGHFNALHAEKLLIFADDATTAQDKRTESILKSMITEPYSIMESKGKVPIKSCCGS